MVSPGARRYMVNVCSASFSLSSCKPQKTQELLWYGLLQIVYAIASPPVCPGAYSRDLFWHGRVAQAPSPSGRGDRSTWPRRSLVSALKPWDTHAAQAQRICHHGDRTERHGDSRE